MPLSIVPVSGLTTNNFDVTGNANGVTFAIGTVVSADGSGTDDEWNITVNATNFAFTYTGTVAFSFDNTSRANIVAVTAQGSNTESISTNGAPASIRFQLRPDSYGSHRGRLSEEHQAR